MAIPQPPPPRLKAPSKRSGRLPKKPGVYFVYTSRHGSLVYVGHSDNLFRRVNTYHEKIFNGDWISWQVCKDGSTRERQYVHILRPIRNDLIKKSGNPLRQWRQEQGLTEPEIADRIGVTRGAVNKWELGKAYPRISVFQSIADMMGIGLGTLTEKWAKWKDQECKS